MNDFEILQRRIELHRQAARMVLSNLIILYWSLLVTACLQLLKRILIQGRCRGFIPSGVVEFCFRVFRLRNE